jgi:hypothetical protein
MASYLRRYEDIKIYYDRDDGGTQKIKQRVYRSRDGDISTPITSLLLARSVEEDDPVPPPGLDPRHIIACFENPNNVTGSSKLKAIIPYAPGNGGLQAHAFEILTYGGVISGEYYGESRKTSFNELTETFLDNLADILRDAIAELIDGVTEELGRLIFDLILSILLGAL